MLKFYMRGCGKLSDGAAAASTAPAAAANEYQFNYLPEGLREGEKAAEGKERESRNFFNMDAAAAANRSFSSYKRQSIDEPEPEPIEVSKGKLPPNRYLFGTLYIDTVRTLATTYYSMGR